MRARVRDGYNACFFPSPPRHLAFFPTPCCLIRHAISPYPPLRFTLPATPLHLISHAVSPYPPRRFILSATPFCLIPNAILPYPQRHFALPHAILPYPPSHFALSATPFFPSSPFDSQLQLLQTGHDGDKPQHAQMVLTALLPPL